MYSVPTIRPITELKNTSTISELCHQTNKPIFITKNGYSDMVIMSASAYERHMLKLEVYEKLAEAEVELDAGVQTVNHKDVMARQRAKLNGKI